MRYPAPEKLEIIRLAEHSHLPAQRTLDRLGVLRRTSIVGMIAISVAVPRRSSAPSRVWNRIPTAIHDQIIELALEQSALSPRELAVRFTDEKGYFVYEASVYRLLKAHDLITSPAYVVIKAANAFHTKTVRPNQMWQTDFTHFKIIGWGWIYLSTVLDDYSRHIITWKPCSTMRARTLPTHWTWRWPLLAATRPLCTTNPDCLVTTVRATSPVNWPIISRSKAMSHVRGAPMHPQT